MEIILNLSEEPFQKIQVKQDIVPYNEAKTFIPKFSSFSDELQGEILMDFSVSNLCDHCNNPIQHWSFEGVEYEFHDWNLCNTLPQFIPPELTEEEIEWKNFQREESKACGVYYPEDYS